MTARHIPALSVAGVALLIALAYAMTLIRTYGPAIREFLLWAVTPQFAMGMFAMALLTSLCAFSLTRIQP